MHLAISDKLFAHVEDQTREYRVDDISGLGRWVDANEGEGGGYEDPVQGYPKTYTPVKRWKKLQVSFEAVDQDEYALLKREGEVREMGKGAADYVEFTAASILADGFATAGPDGQFLFSNSHPKNREETGTTYDNLLDGAFSHDNLETAETQIANNYFNSKGIPIQPLENPYLVYGPALRGTVERVLSDRALERPGVTTRDINRFAGRYQPLESRYLSAALAGSATMWFIIYSELDFLKLIWQVKPHFSYWIDHDNEYYNWKGRMLLDMGESNWRCGFGSTGA